MNYITVRFFFDSLDGAVEALILLLEDARASDKDYSLGSLSADQVLTSGLLLMGDAEHLIPSILNIPGS